MKVYVLTVDYDAKHNYDMDILRKVLQFNETEHIYSSFRKANMASCELCNMFEDDIDYVDEIQECHDGMLRRVIVFTDYCTYDMDVVITVKTVEVL